MLIRLAILQPLALFRKQVIIISSSIVATLSFLCYDRPSLPKKICWQGRALSHLDYLPEPLVIFFPDLFRAESVHAAYFKSIWYCLHHSRNARAISGWLIRCMIVICLRSLSRGQFYRLRRGKV